MVDCKVSYLIYGVLDKLLKRYREEDEKKENLCDAIFNATI